MNGRDVLQLALVGLGFACTIGLGIYGAIAGWSEQDEPAPAWAAIVLLIGCGAILAAAMSAALGNP